MSITPIEAAISGEDACNLIGAVIGARTAITKGSEFVRRVFLVVVALLILRLAWDVFAG